MNCPSILELTTRPLSAATRQHVAECVRCQALLAAWDADPVPDEPELDLPVAELPSWQPRADPRSPATVGAIHTVAAPGEDVFLLGLVTGLRDRQASIMPLSTEIHWAADWDVLLDADVLGYGVMVEAWNVVDVLTEQLIEQLATYPRSELFVDLYERGRAGTGAPDGLPDGPPIESEEDPRWLFREHERQRVRSFGEPARVVNLGDTLGKVVRAVREEQGTTTDELAAAVNLELASIRRIEEDREDLLAHVPLGAFTSLLVELNVPQSEVFLGYVEEAAFRNERFTTPDQTAVYARRRRGARVRREPGSEPERRARAKAWVGRLRLALRGQT